MSRKCIPIWYLSLFFLAFTGVIIVVSIRISITMASGESGLFFSKIIIIIIARINASFLVCWLCFDWLMVLPSCHKLLDLLYYSVCFSYYVLSFSMECFLLLFNIKLHIYDMQNHTRSTDLYPVYVLSWSLICSLYWSSLTGLLPRQIFWLLKQFCLLRPLDCIRTEIEKCIWGQFPP